ncbi:DUF4381 domain-containing protein [Marinobacter sp. ANT_B65]|uniref:DUF4381 domain-containing protein n=1 Tax=Marinobacter sp. ANT_B65 TaxID=2039467 RepID=UPI000BBE4F41|nr:DUF4381 domain-containing protein [Marinobacter sp. ANT_B65]PCM45355.1 hypothetical protein CPA50_04940 [Marinobacter sp. ANT_B65]
MMADDPLSQLRDIHLPQAGGFWPPAPGWWVLAIALLVGISALIWLVRRHRHKNRWLAPAKAELAYLERNASKEPQWFSQLNTLLKRVAQARYPEAHPEALSGRQWAAFLLQNLPDNGIAQQAIAEALVNSTWQPEPAAEPAQALKFARLWLEAQKC